MASVEVTPPATHPQRKPAKPKRPPVKTRPPPRLQQMKSMPADLRFTGTSGARARRESGAAAAARPTGPPPLPPAAAAAASPDKLEKRVSIFTEDLLEQEEEAPHHTKQRNDDDSPYSGKIQESGSSEEGEASVGSSSKPSASASAAAATTPTAAAAAVSSLPHSDSRWSDTTAFRAKKKQQAWCRLENGDWALGTILSTSGSQTVLSVLEGRILKVNREELLHANPEILDGVDDLMQLSYLHEPSGLYNLQYRCEEDMIYTKAGPVLVAVNPFKFMKLYGPDYVEAYRKKSITSPHVYAIADTAICEMIRDEVNQSIIISGESSVGKTETAKIAMQYLASLGGGSGIEYEILQSNPILEAFGNAKTLRNDIPFALLYKEAPNLYTCLMDLYMKKMRFEAVKCTCKSYRPVVPVAYVVQTLGFSKAASCGETSQDANGLEECED